MTAFNNFIISPLNSLNGLNVSSFSTNITDLNFMDFNSSIFANVSTPQMETNTQLSFDIKALNKEIDEINEAMFGSGSSVSNDKASTTPASSTPASSTPSVPTTPASVEASAISDKMASSVVRPSQNEVVISQVDAVQKQLMRKLEAAGYDKETAKKLAGQSLAETAGRKSSIGYCARYVNNALEKAGLVDTDSTRKPSAYQLASVYENNPAFAKVEVSREELKNLPAGCIVVWQRGGGFGQAFAKHGHVFITQGNGKATSDYLQDIKDYNTPFTVFVPKKA
jgi:hypothetical protein